MPRHWRIVREEARKHEETRGWPRVAPTSPMIDPQFKVKPKARPVLARFKVKLAALKKLGFKGGRRTLHEIEKLYTKLAAIYDMPAPAVTHPGKWQGPASVSYTEGATPVVLAGRLSVLATLHGFARARGYGETGAVWWSVNTFRLMWPGAWKKLENVPGTATFKPREPAKKKFPPLPDDFDVRHIIERFKRLDLD